MRKHPAALPQDVVGGMRIEGKMNIVNRFTLFFLFISMFDMVANAQQTQEQRAQRAAEREAERIRITAERRIEFLDWTREHLAYPRGYFIDNRLITIVTIENDNPVLNHIDIFEGKVVTKNKLIFSYFWNEDNSYRDYILAGFKASQYSEGELRFVLRKDKSKNTFSLFTNGDSFDRGTRRHDFKFVEKTDDTIPEEIFWMTTDSQMPYTGNFIFNDFKITMQYNHEITKEWVEENFNRKISIVLGEGSDSHNGILKGINFPLNRHSGIFGDQWFRITNNDKTIARNGADGPRGGLGYSWYFDDENTIYHTYWEQISPFDESDDIQHSAIEYTVKYTRQ